MVTMAVDITAKKPDASEIMDRRNRSFAKSEDDATKPRKEARPVTAIVGPK
jgi:hypothetical protein